MVEAETQMDMMSVRTVKPKMIQQYKNFGKNDLLIHKSTFVAYSIIFYNPTNTTCCAVTIYSPNLHENEYHDECDFQKTMNDEEISLKKWHITNYQDNEKNNKNKNNKNKNNSSNNNSILKPKTHWKKMKTMAINPNVANKNSNSTGAF